MWSIGCILGELLAGKPMFPGTSTMNQLERIIAVTGVPSKADIASINSPFAETMIDNLPPVPNRQLNEIYPRASPEAIDMMRKLLYFNPSRRLNAEEALKHPFVSMFHDPNSEPTCAGPITIAFDDYTKYSIHEYRDKLYYEVSKRKRELKRDKYVTCVFLKKKKSFFIDPSKINTNRDASRAHRRESREGRHGAERGERRSSKEHRR